MKKAISIILTICLITSAAVIFTACKKGDESKGTPVDPSHVSEDENLDPTIGHKAPVIDTELERIFKEATNELDGADYKAIAYIGMSAEDGYVFLAVQTPVIPDPKSTYAVVRISDSDGKAQIIEIIPSELEAIADAEKELVGGWAKSEDLKVTDEAKKALEKACETLAGATYNPVALLGTQVVAGMNYLIVCEMTATVPGAKTDYAIVTVYADLEGNCEITDTTEFLSDSGSGSETAEEASETSEPAEGATKAESDVVYGSYDEAKKDAGFDLDTPDLASATFKVITDTANNTIFEIRSDGTYIRKTKGSADISPDPTDYPETSAETTDDGREINFKGEDGKIFLMTWTNDGFSYCVGFKEGASRSEADTYINWVK